MLTLNLSEVRRYTEHWEKQASLQLRSGSVEAIDAYQAHGRILQGEREGLVDVLYRPWKADVEAGKTSLHRRQCDGRRAE